MTGREDDQWKEKSGRKKDIAKAEREKEIHWAKKNISLGAVTGNLEEDWAGDKKNDSLPLQSS